MKAIIFDMDGLMVDSERLYHLSQQEIAATYNKKLNPKILWKMMGRKPIEGIKIFVKEMDIPADAEEVLNMRNDMMEKKISTDLLPMPGLEYIIDRFYGKLKLAVATGAQKKFLDLVVDILDIRGKFAVLQDSDDIKIGKPDPEIYLKACEKLGLDPGSCVVLEDSSNGALAGRRAGCYVIAIPTEYTKGQDFSFVDFIAQDLFEAVQHINHLLPPTAE